jgi:hypothetical protein
MTFRAPRSLAAVTSWATRAAQHDNLNSRTATGVISISPAPFLAQFPVTSRQAAVPTPRQSIRHGLLRHLVSAPHEALGGWAEACGRSIGSAGGS